MADPDPLRVTDPAKGASGPRRIISVPDPVRGSKLLIAATSGHAEDKNWRRGVAVLWTLFGLIALAEACTVVFSALAGYTGPLPFFDLLRLLLLGGVFLSMWFGWGWTRWVLAVFSFLFGVAQAMQLLRVTDMALRSGGGGKGGDPLPGSSLYNAPVLVACLLYLVLALYLAFSSDLAAFIEHRREQGRKWIVAPVALLAGIYVALLFLIPPAYGEWVASQNAAAVRFGRDTLQAMAEHWDVAAFESRCDAGFLATFPARSRAGMMRSFTPLGPVQSFGEEAGSANSTFDAQANGFVLRGNYDGFVHFAHGGAMFSFTMTRSLFSPWRLTFITADKIVIDPPPAAPPAEQPAPAPAESPAPAATPETAPVVPSPGS